MHLHLWGRGETTYGGHKTVCYSLIVYLKVTVSSDATSWSQYCSVGWSYDSGCSFQLPSVIWPTVSSCQHQAHVLIENPRDLWTQFSTECQEQGGDGDPDVYRTICIRLQISPMYFLVIGENSADKVPDKHKHTINVFLSLEQGWGRGNGVGTGGGGKDIQFHLKWNKMECVWWRLGLG